MLFLRKLPSGQLEVMFEESRVEETHRRGKAEESVVVEVEIPEMVNQREVSEREAQRM